MNSSVNPIHINSYYMHCRNDIDIGTIFLVSCLCLFSVYNILSFSSNQSFGDFDDDPLINTNCQGKCGSKGNLAVIGVSFRFAGTNIGPKIIILMVHMRNVYTYLCVRVCVWVNNCGFCLSQRYSFFLFFFVGLAQTVFIVRNVWQLRMTRCST